MKRLIPILILLTASCGEETKPAPTPMEYMLQHSEDYLTDTDYRRDQLELSLWDDSLPYARKRLAGYALSEGGWDALPELSTTSHSVGTNQTFELSPDETPRTLDAWIALGESVFWNMPMRKDTYLKWVSERPELWVELGMQTNADGSLRGIVAFESTSGEPAVGATCGLCHGDAGLAGRANRDLDLGAGRALWLESLSRSGDIYKQWGPGRVDVTDDRVVDPLAIPDLWGVDSQTHMNTSGAVKLESPAALAVRFETQYIVGHGLEARPDRRLTWALAMYVLSLEAPQAELQNDPIGADIFERECASCHQPELAFSGPLVPSHVMVSDSKAAHSVLRGTGFLKTPTLLGIADGAPYLHDASVPDLKTFLATEHVVGTTLTDEEQQHLLRFLSTL